MLLTLGQSSEFRPCTRHHVLLRRLQEAPLTVVSQPSALCLFAWVRRADDSAAGFLRAGTLVMDDTPAGDPRFVTASFEYDETYLADRDAYAIDPINMPLQSGFISTKHAHVALGAIFDAAPDSWGRRVAHSAEPDVAIGGSVYRQAFLRGTDGIGALVLTPPDQAVCDLPALINKSIGEGPNLNQLDDVARVTRMLEETNFTTEENRHLLAGSWTIGGARPKAIVRNVGTYGDSDALPGDSLIAKFPSLNESIDRAGVEWVFLRMARDAGFEVPGHTLARVLTGRALLLERFDRFAFEDAVHSSHEGRRHYISANSLVSATPQSKRLDTVHDTALFSCGNLISIAGRVAARPAQARAEMFARVLFNTAAHNTDDHLKNFGFVQDGQDANAFKVAPVFDVSPQGMASHFIHLADRGRDYTTQDVVACASKLGISRSLAAAAWERMAAVLERRYEYYGQAQLLPHEIEAVERLVKRGTGGCF